MLEVVGLGTLLRYNGVDIDVDEFKKIQLELMEFFDGDSQKALDVTKEKYTKTMEMLKK